MNKLFLALLLTVAPAHASLNDASKAEIVHDNILFNPGFQNGKAGWAVSTGSFSVAGSGVDMHAVWDAGAASETFCSKAITVPDKLKGQNGYWRIKVDAASTGATHTVYAYDGASVLGNVETVSSGAELSPVAGNLVYPSSGTVQLCIESQADEPSIQVYGGSLGDAANLTQIPVNGYEIKTLSADVTAAGTIADLTFSDLIVGREYKVTLQARLQKIGSLGFNSVAITHDGGDLAVAEWDSTSNSNNGAIAAGTSVNFKATAADLTFVYARTSTSDILMGNNTQSETFAMLEELSNTSQGFKADQTNRPWTAYTPTFTGFGTVSASECYHKRQGEDMLLRCAFTPGTSTAVEGRLSLPGSYVSASTVATLEVAGMFLRGVSTPDNGGATLIEASVGYITFTDKDVFGSGTNGGLAKVNGSIVASTGQPISLKARIPIEGWNETMNAPLIKGSVVTTSSAPSADESAFIDFQTSNTITQSGDWIDSVTDNSLGNYDVNIRAGVFSGTPSCVISYEEGNRHCGISYPDAVTVHVLCRQPATSGAIDADIDIHCKGDK